MGKKEEAILFQKELETLSKYPFSMLQHMFLVPMVLLTMFIVFELVAFHTIEGYGWGLEWYLFLARDILVSLIILTIAFTMYLREKERLKQRFLQIYRQRDEIDQLKDSFLSNVSHELRTPLTIINGYIKYLLNEKPGDLNSDQSKFLAIASDESDRLQHLIEELLFITSMDRMKIPLQKEAMDVADIVRSAVQKMDVRAKAKDIEILRLIPKSSVTLTGDKQRLTQVITNLIDNAIKFTPVGGRIEVRLREHEKNITIDIIDSGIGIPKEKLDKVFERFYQVDGKTSRVYSGAGLGLAICRDIVKALGGEISVKSPVSRANLKRMGFEGKDMAKVKGAMFRVDLRSGK